MFTVEQEELELQPLSRPPRRLIVIEPIPVTLRRLMKRIFIDNDEIDLECGFEIVEEEFFDEKVNPVSLL
ncbi:hypothetical protein SCUCBS95973_000706 [Sporothrix curviconia]|uniref:Uncharacterized protein n=1 Tax=Sporothrix curviconia TaxID=1260050 RepID=A0ABP0ASI5_9PEZI